MTIIPLRVAENGVTLPMTVAENGGTVPLGVEQVRVIEYVTRDYNLLDNKPSIEGVQLQGDKTFVQLGLNDISAQDIDEIIYGGM